VLVTGATDGRQNVTFPPDHGHVSGRSLPMDLGRRPASYRQAIQQLLCLYVHPRRCTWSVSSTAETRMPRDGATTSIYITSTSPSAQCSAIVSKPGKKIPLR
jgi:hypothetical protein